MGDIGEVMEASLSFRSYTFSPSPGLPTMTLRVWRGPGNLENASPVQKAPILTASASLLSCVTLPSQTSLPGSCCKNNGARLSMQLSSRSRLASLIPRSPQRHAPSASSKKSPDTWAKSWAVGSMSVPSCSMVCCCSQYFFRHRWRITVEFRSCYGYAPNNTTHTCSIIGHSYHILEDLSTPLSTCQKQKQKNRREWTLPSRHPDLGPKSKR